MRGTAKWSFALGAAGLLVAGHGCTSSASPGGASPDSGAEAGTGTVGQPCATDGDCGGVAAGLAGRCSAGAFQAGPLLPTPVCIANGCTIPDPSAVAFCDGTAGAGSMSPGAAPLGVCVNAGAVNVCLPLCTFDASGAAPEGCQGKDACNVAALGATAGDGGAATAYGVGYCFGGCGADSDCPPGSACQVEDGVCVASKLTYSLSIGAACTQGESGTSAGCNCEYRATTGAGYCTDACVQGGAPCPGGYVCDSFLPTTLAVEGGTVPGFSKEPPGLAGVCVAACSTPDASGDAGACPGSSTCQAGGLAGDDCQP
jgi:hypothetical protein